MKLRSLILKVKRFPVTTEQWSRLFVSVGLIIFTISGDYRLSQVTWASRVEAHQLTPVVSEQRFYRPQSLVIGETLEVAVETGFFVEDAWSLSQTTALFANDSAFPGQPGNTIIYGHNSDKILGKLSRVEVGDILSVTTTDGKLHSYSIIEKSIVPLDQTHYLEPTTEHVLTMYTCSGWMDTKRLVIRAKPLP